MDKQPYIDRILETENLTDELEDAEANTLINWGVAQLDRVLQGADDPEEGGRRVNNLMAVMRKINRILGGYKSKSSKALAKDIADLRRLTAQASGSSPSFSTDGAEKASPEQAAQDVSGLSTHEALEYLFKQ
ncbi:MAG TPA: hypothetical protein VMT46_05225 [Anaerolineaceae bacterium]|nr:hypothetical protein [Anaerolineaceae bacterium]